MPQTWTWCHERHIASDTQEGRQVVDELLQQLQSENWSEHDIFGVHLAVEEALVNAIKHGNQLAADKSVHVWYKMSPEILRIEIEDEGGGFDPEDVPDPTMDENLEIPSGRGLMLMRSYMSRVEFNERGNRVLMEKKRT